MKKVPKRRFKGFLNAGDWEQRKLISCIQKVIDFRGRTPNKLGMEWSCSGHLALSALNVKDGYIDFSQDNHYGDNDLYEKWMTGNELHKGQVVFTTEAPMGNVAQIPDNERYILSQRTVAFCVDENIITENFLAVLLRTPVVFKTLTKLSSGGTAQGISQKSLAEIEVRIPPNLHEQQIISNFLLSFEHCITLHQRKLEKLQATKKALLYELFPIENSRRPKLRFKGFTGDWEQRKLGDVVKRESVTQVSSTEYPAIEYEDVIPETGQLNKDIYKKGVQKAGILFDANKVLYGKLRPYLHNWVAPMYKGVAVGDWWVLNPCGLDRGFLYTLIQTVKFDTIANQSTGSKMPRADWKLLSTTEFSIPSLDEQIKIGKLVEGLNDYITLHQ